MPHTIIVSGEFLTLDLLLTRSYGYRGQQLLEQAYELNPGLSSKKSYIPLGTSVVIPDEPEEYEADFEPVYSLFDDI